jgi:uncharacterized protein YggE
VKRTRIAIMVGTAVAVAVVVAVARPGAAASAEEPVAGITVNGVGSVTVVPDRATFWFGVQSEGRTASAALAANATEMRRVVDALRGAGIAAADIQTQQVSVNPRTNETGAIVGYTAVNNVSVRVRDLDRTGAVIDAAVTAGANTVNGPQLTRGDQAAPYRNALRAAIADARAKAQQLAEAANVRLGTIVAVAETGGAVPLPAAEARSAADTPVVPGTQEIQATVTVTFGLTE